MAANITTQQRHAQRQNATTNHVTKGIPKSVDMGTNVDLEQGAYTNISTMIKAQI